MGKLLDRLNKQLKSEHKQEVKDAEDCIKIYNMLKETTGHVWESEWRVLVNTKFKGYPSDSRTFEPTSMGHRILKTIE